MIITTDIDKVHFELGDFDGAGVKPDGENFTDMEIQYFLDAEGGSIMNAVARACEVLARAWAGAGDITVGPRSERFGGTSEKWRKMAAELRAQHGGSGTNIGGDISRTDGYATRAGGTLNDA